jgi:hypothetical protein
VCSETHAQHLRWQYSRINQLVAIISEQVEPISSVECQQDAVLTPQQQEIFCLLLE